MTDTKEHYYKKDENYEIVCICMEAHRLLGPGLLEVVYKDALGIEFKNKIFPIKEKKNIM